MNSLHDLLQDRKEPEKRRVSKRGELLKYFSKKTGWNIPRLARKLAHLKDLEDWYYIKSISDKYELESRGPWAKCFFGSLKI